MATQSNRFISLDPEWIYELQLSSQVSAPNSTSRDVKIEAYAKEHNLHIFNGPTVCLDAFNEQEKELLLSQGEFYDLFIQTVIAPSAARPPAAIAVSALLEDSQGNFLLTKRSSNVAIGQRLLCTSATGALEPDDFEFTQGSLTYSNPFCQCGAREIQEELGLEIEEPNLKIEGLFFGALKRQPVILISGKTNSSFPENEICRFIAETTDSSIKELDRVMIVSQTEIPNIIENENMSEATAYHLALHCS